jgi:NADPH2:quinone reductase
VLVAGGAGAVGNSAIQLAAWAGATVLSTVSSPEKAALARAAGANHVIDYRAEDTAARIRELTERGPDLIVEVSAANLALDVDVIAPNGSIALYMGGPSGDALTGFPALAKNVSCTGVLTYTTTPEQKDNAVAAVADAVAAGVFRVGADAGLPLIRFPLDRIAEAHEAVERHVVGKVLVDVSAP